MRVEEIGVAQRDVVSDGMWGGETMRRDPSSVEWTKKQAPGTEEGGEPSLTERYISTDLNASSSKIFVIPTPVLPPTGDGVDFL